MISFPIAIVLYNPSDSIINRILYFLKKGVVLYIFDNSANKNEILSTCSNPNLTYYGVNRNFGLSYSINYLCEMAILQNRKTLLFFDQDTIFTMDSLDYVDNFLRINDSHSKGFFDNVLSVNFRDSEAKQSKLNIIETGVINDYLYYNVYFNINSGTLYFLDNFKKFKWFDENYFVDGVDYFLSLNTIINRYKNLVITNVPGLNHREEQGDQEILLFGKKITGRVYPINRNYDFIRSHLKLLLRTFKIKEIKPKLFIAKAMFSYIGQQLIFRLRNLFVRAN